MAAFETLRNKTTKQAHFHSINWLSYFAICHQQDENSGVQMTLAIYEAIQTDIYMASDAEECLPSVMQHFGLGLV